MQKIGPREAALRAQREANLAAAKAKGPRITTDALVEKIEVAKQKRGKLVKRKAKKK